MKLSMPTLATFVMISALVLVAIEPARAIGPRIVVNKNAEFTVGDNAIAIIPGQCSADLDCDEAFEAVRQVAQTHWNSKLLKVRSVTDAMRKLNMKETNKSNRSALAEELGVGMFLITHLRLDDAKGLDEDQEVPFEIELILVNAVTNAELLRGIASWESTLDDAIDNAEDMVSQILDRSDDKE